MWINKNSKTCDTGYGIRDTCQKGFTLIELLIVIAIIGILATLSVVALDNARRRARDTKRLTDVQQVRNGLVIFANNRASYPEVSGTDTLELGGSSARCLDDNGFHTGEGTDTCGGLIIMPHIPNEQIPGHAPYRYERTPDGYQIQFLLEGPIANLGGGLCIATQEKVSCTP